MLTACNLPKSQPPANPATVSASPTSENVDESVPPEAETIEESFPASDLTELYLQKVSAGEWTEGEGLVFLLKAAIGETDLEIPASVIERELTSTVSLAGDYLKTGTDEAAKAEITRLLKILIPSQKILDLYSIPAISAHNGTGKLASPAKQQLDCASLWRNGFPDQERTPSFPCFQFGEILFGGESSYKVYYPLEWQNDPTKIEYYNATLDALADSAATYSSLGTLPSAYIYFSVLDGPANAGAGTYYDWFQQGEACPIAIYPLLLIQTIGDFKQSIAHELAHCFQVTNFKDQYLGSTKDSLWWKEGSAEYLSNLVYPANDYEYRFLGQFNTRSLTSQITVMSYENSLFFQFLGNELGNAGVLNFIRAMPTGPGENAQLSAISTYPDIANLYEKFTRQFLSVQIRDTAGVVKSYRPEFKETLVISSSQRTSGTLLYKPFTMRRYLFEYPAGFNYTFSLAGIVEPDFRSASAPIDIPIWVSPANDINAFCDPLLYMVYGIGLGTGTAIKKQAMQVDLKEVANNQVCDSASCLTGTWALDPSSYLVYANSLFAPGMGISTAVRSEGQMYMVYSADGQASSLIALNDPFLVFYSGSFPDPEGGRPIPALQTVRFIPSAAVSYRADASTITYSGSRGTIKINGSLTLPTGEYLPYDVDPAAFGGANLPISEKYFCRGDFLSIIPILPAPANPNPSPMFFRRILSPSP